MIEGIAGRLPSSELKHQSGSKVSKTIKPSHLSKSGRQRPAAVTHRTCEYDEEAGGMVETQEADQDWLNGRCAMPHEQEALQRWSRASRPAAKVCIQGLNTVQDSEAMNFRT